MRTLIGKWAVCHRGRVGLIEERKRRRGKYVYVGRTIDNLPWQSIKPTVIDENHVEKIDLYRFELS